MTNEDLTSILCIVHSLSAILQSVENLRSRLLSFIIGILYLLNSEHVKVWTNDYWGKKLRYVRVVSLVILLSQTSTLSGFLVNFTLFELWRHTYSVFSWQYPIFIILLKKNACFCLYVCNSFTCLLYNCSKNKPT